MNQFSHAKPAWGLALVLICGLLTACGGPPVPAWQLQAAQSSAQFRDLALQGRQSVANARFAEAEAHLRRAGQMEAYGRLLLQRQALDWVLHREPEPIAPAIREWMPAADAALAAFFENPLAADARLLPVDYRGFVSAWQSGGEPQVSRALGRVKDPFRRLVCASIYLQANPGADVTVRLPAIEWAAANGWTAPMLLLLRQHVAAASARGDEAASRSAAARIRFIEEGL
jgi:hypothetical protein